MRYLTYKIGRRLYAWARGEVKNNPCVNGEYWLVEQMLKLTQRDIVMLDIGANKGEWSAKCHEVFTSKSKAVKDNLVIHAFEPCSATYKILAKYSETIESVRTHQFALSDKAGTARFYSKSVGAGTNSLHYSSGEDIEDVTLTTIDDFADKHSIGEIQLIKIDTEGFDFLVLTGAKRMLSRALVDCIQFEYNWRWLLNRRSLYDVFELAKHIPYRVAKLSGKKILIFDKYHFEMDKFFEGNYLLIKKGSGIEQIARPAYFTRSNILRY